MKTLCKLKAQREYLRGPTEIGGALLESSIFENCRHVTLAGMIGLQTAVPNFWVFRKHLLELSFPMAALWPKVSLNGVLLITCGITLFRQ